MDITSQYKQLKPFLFATAYNMTGQVHEAEDLVQDAFEDVLKKKELDVQNVKSYLTRIVINKAIDRLTRLKKNREQYPALWLPEPYITESESAQNADVLPYAFLYLIESLNPVERAVFILRESFDYTYEEIASLCEISTDNCRQILHRAKTKVKQAPASGHVHEAQTGEALLQEFLKACLSQDATRLSELLKEDVILYSDGGGKVSAARKILEGISKVTRFISGIIKKGFNKWSGARQIFVNNEPALLMPDDQRVHMVLIPYTDAGKVSKLFIMRNPEKIFVQDPVTK